MLEDIPVQDESDVSIRTRGRRTNRSSSSQLPKGSSGSTRRRASAGPATSLTRASEPRGPGQGGQESAVSAVDTLQASGRGSLQAYGRGDFITIDEGESSRADTLQAYGRGDSNADGGGESSRADTLQAYGRGSLQVYDRGDSNVGSDEESTGASGAVDLEPPLDERTSTGVTTGFGGPATPPAVEGSGDATTRVGRRSSTRASTTRTSTAYTDTRVLPMQQRVRPARREPIVILPTPVRVTRTAAQRRVPGFVIGRSPSKHSGNGRPPPTEVTMRDSPYDSEEEVDPWFAQEVPIEYKDFVDEILEELPDAIQMTTETSLAISRDSNPISGGGSNANSGGLSGPVDTQLAISRDSNANSGGEFNANSGGQSATNASVPAALEVRDPPTRRASRRAVVYDKYTRDAFIAIVSCNSAADRNRDCLRSALRTRMCTPSLGTSLS